MSPIRTLCLVSAVTLLTACASGQSESLKTGSDTLSTEMRKGRPGRPDMAAVAEKLGVSSEALQEAFGKAGGPPPDLDVVAAELGISVDELKAALPSRPGR